MESLLQSNLLFSSRGEVKDLRDISGPNHESLPKWLPPELDGLSGADMRVLTLDDKQKADVYALGATIVEVCMSMPPLVEPVLDRC
jgi:hypothetical protein